MGEQVKLRTGYIVRDESEAFMRRVRHRHHAAPQGAILHLGCWAGDELHGIAIIGRPVSRVLAARGVMEVTRCWTDGTPNACSALYGAARKVALALSAPKLITYILASETGVTLRAAGWRRDGETDEESEVSGRDWRACKRRQAQAALFDLGPTSPTDDKIRWCAW